MVSMMTSECPAQAGVLGVVINNPVTEPVIVTSTSHSRAGGGFGELIPFHCFKSLITVNNPQNHMSIRCILRAAAIVYARRLSRRNDREWNEMPSSSY